MKYQGLSVISQLLRFTCKELNESESELAVDEAIELLELSLNCFSLLFDVGSSS